MKTLYRFFGIFTLTLALITLLLGFYFRQQNKILYQTTSNLPEVLKTEQLLADKNTTLKKKLEGNKDVLTALSKYLILPKHEISDTPTRIYNPEVQRDVSVYENYLSGFIAYDDCVKILEKLCETQLSISITSLSIHRSIAHNYALQLSMTYRTE